MSYGLGRLQSLLAVLSRLTEARSYLLGTEQAADLEIAQELDGVAAKVKERRDSLLMAISDEVGKLTCMAPDERARVALQQLPQHARLRLIADQVLECRPDEQGAEVAERVRSLAA
jgi:hypothetical protein